MEFFKHDANIDFMGARRATALLSLVLFVLSIGAVILNGVKLGLDFTGGTQIEVSYKQAADLPTIRNALSAVGFKEAVVQSYGSSENVLINIAPHAEYNEKTLTDQVIAALPGARMERTEFLGPQVGKELATKGILAIIVSFICTMIYIALRFEYRLAVSAIAALVHDPVLILGIFSYWGIEFDLKALAALLAVIGYSLNDTIVVFDRVRENFRKMRKATPIDIMNTSINQTLSRTIMTSLLTLIVVVALFLYGGETIHGFSLALIIGIVIGTYSSIYVAGAMAITLGLNRQDLLPTPKQAADELP